MDCDMPNRYVIIRHTKITR